MATSIFGDYNERQKAFVSLYLGADLGFTVHPEMAAKLETPTRTAAVPPELGDWAVIDSGPPDPTAEIAEFVHAVKAA